MDAVFMVVATVTICIVGLSVALFMLSMAADLLGIDVAYIIDQHRNKDD